MSKKAEINRQLEKILERIERNLRTMIDLQKAEDAVPDPEDFQAKVADYARTAVAQDTRRLDQERRKSLGKKAGVCVTKMPDRPVYQYPFKTKKGVRLPLLWDKVAAACRAVRDFPFDGSSERKHAAAKLRACRRLLITNFPDLKKNSDTKWLNRHYFVYGLEIPLRVIPRQIAKNAE
jgi:hypothetical protein